MDLITGYLLILLALFAGNIALMLGNYKINNIKILLISAGISAITLALMYGAGFLKSTLAFLIGYFSYFFIAVAVLQLIILLYYRRDSEKNLMPAISCLLGMFFISVFILSSQSNLIFVDYLLFSLIVLILLFAVYQVSKLLVHAKRDYPVVIGEYVCLSSILIFIFALTYHSTLSLDYSMFTSFLILTPTYQLVYVCISIGVVLMIGLLYNDKQMKGGKN